MKKVMTIALLASLIFGGVNYSRGVEPITQEQAMEKYLELKKENANLKEDLESARKARNEAAVEIQELRDELSRTKKAGRELRDKYNKLKIYAPTEYSPIPDGIKSTEEYVEWAKAWADVDTRHPELIDYHNVSFTNDVDNGSYCNDKETKSEKDLCMKKPVKVSSYTRKDGTVVRGHTRAPKNCADWYDKEGNFVKVRR